MDFEMKKPPSIRGYPLHRMAAELAAGEKILFADYGESLLLRTSKSLELEKRPMRTFSTGDIIGFELRACVGKKVKGKHRYYPTSDWRSRHAWLEAQGAAHGFVVISLHCAVAMQTIKAGDRNFTVDQTDFTGVLKITEVEKFSMAVENGIGNKAKAFGFGMLVI